ncbi:MAG: hypothetical protein LBR38_09890 [Synergistaceae bacterium]|jgi:anti-sigma regulatory factor (Ser/Thr protein kinase)|nr:hypothetical protein [Synergistaceae bacterium]
MKQTGTHDDFRTEFLSRMSHEIRTPLNAIMGMANLAMKSDDRAKIRDCLAKIGESAKFLNDIMGDILDMSSLENHSLKLAAVPFDIGKVFAGVYKRVEPAAKEKRLSLTFSVDDALQGSFIGDADRIGQILFHLLDNAVKFTPESGDVVFRARLAGSSWETGGGAHKSETIEVLVEDTGIGISKENIARIFRPFEQMEGGTSRKYGGLGLGLAITKRILDLMGGTLHVSSREGRGTTFSITFNLLRGERRPSNDYIEVVHTSMSETEAGGMIAPIMSHEREVEILDEEAWQEHAAAKASPPEQKQTEAQTQTQIQKKSEAEPLSSKPDEPPLVFDNAAYLPFVDFTQTLAHLNGNRRLCLTLLRSCMKNAMIDAAEHAFNAGDFAEAAECLGALRSVAAVLALTDLQSKAAQLEGTAEGNVFDHAMLDKLKASMNETRGRLPALIALLEGSV